MTTKKTAPAPKKPLSPIGKIVVVRCYSAGVHVGKLAAFERDRVTLTDSQRLWHFYVAKQTGQVASCSELAVHGIDRERTRRAAVVPVQYLTGAIEVIPCTAQAAETYRP